MKKKIWGLVAATLFAIDLVGANYLLDFAIARKAPSAEHNVSPTYAISEEGNNIIKNNEKSMLAQTKVWLEHSRLRELKLKTEDGLELWAKEVKPANFSEVSPQLNTTSTYKASTQLNTPSTSEAPAGLNKSIAAEGKTYSHKWVIPVHGYTRDHHYMENIACQYAQRGYNVLLPDLRAHGKSQGQYIGMGWLDRKDLLGWINTIVAQDPQATIVLHGISMGAATVMMTAGEELPANVKAIVEDCGYTSVWDIFSDEIKYLYSLPEFPLLHTADALSKLKAGYGFKEANALASVKRSRVPMMFIHGTADTFVTPKAAPALYEACLTRKELLLIKEAPHAKAYLRNPEEYFSRLFAFLEK